MDNQATQAYRIIQISDNEFCIEAAPPASPKRWYWPFRTEAKWKVLTKVGERNGTFYTAYRTFDSLASAEKHLADLRKYPLVAKDPA